MNPAPTPAPAPHPHPDLLRRYHVALTLFLLGLIGSGLTAFPLLAEIRVLSAWLGIHDPAAYQSYSGLSHWIAYVQLGLEQTYAKFPFFGYGTDWLAFGHLASAVLFAGAFAKPLERDWVLRYGLVICASVIPLAFIAGSVRGIPVYWRLVDCSFGVFGALPLLYCLSIVKRMRQA